MSLLQVQQKHVDSQALCKISIKTRKRQWASKYDRKLKHSSQVKGTNPWSNDVVPSKGNAWRCKGEAWAKWRPSGEKRLRRDESSFLLKPKAPCNEHQDILEHSLFPGGRGKSNGAGTQEGQMQLGKRGYNFASPFLLPTSQKKIPQTQENSRRNFPTHADAKSLH